MPKQFFLDRYLYQYRLFPSHLDSSDINHFPGYEIRRQAQVLGDQHAYHTDIWYPGFKSYVTTEIVPRAVHPPHHATLPNHDLRGVLAAGKRQTSDDEPQDILQLAARAEVGVAISELSSSKRDPPMEIYELPADDDYAGSLEVGSCVSESHHPICSGNLVQDKSKRSSLLPDFGYLKPLITSTSSFSVQVSTPHVEGVDDFAYLGRYVTTGAPPRPVGPSSGASSEEDFSYVAKLIEVGRRLSRHEHRRRSHRQGPLYNHSRQPSRWPSQRYRLTTLPVTSTGSPEVVELSTAT
jgi:hypothetical protein